MTSAILAMIRLYWRIVPESRRRQCLFRETCSRYVYRQARESGVRGAFLAAYRRLRACRPGFQVQVRDYTFEVVCRDGTVITQADLGAVVTDALSGAVYS